MPKPMKFTIEVEERFFGPIWRRLDTMQGVVALHYHTEGVKTPPKDPTPRSRGKASEGTTSQCIILQTLQEQGMVHRKVLEAALEESGRKAASLNSLLSKTKEAKLIRSKGPGVYEITAAGTKFVETSCPIGESK
jgi:hypothetical protein